MPRTSPRARSAKSRAAASGVPPQGAGETQQAMRDGVTSAAATLSPSRSSSPSTERANEDTQAPARLPTKVDQVRALLAREGGATLADLQAATGWQPHSVRAALSGLRKAGHAINKSRDEAAVTTYRLSAPATDQAEQGEGSGAEGEAEAGAAIKAAAAAEPEAEASQ